MWWLWNAGRLAVWTLAAVIGWGCSSGSTSSRTTAPSCIEGGSCACPSGNAGVERCGNQLDGLSSCYCQGDGMVGTGTDSGAGDAGGCSPFTPAEPPNFQACGGEPFGMWQATAVELGPNFTVFVDVFRNPSIGDFNCPILPGAAAAPNFLLYLGSGGISAYAFGAWSFDYQWASNCSKYQASPCIQPFSADEPACSCQDAGCGVSSCTAQINSIWGGSLQGGSTWTRSGSTIVIQNVTSFAYCVQGDTMRMTWGGALFTMKRVQAGGVPTPCAERSAAACTASGDCHAACTGGTQCSDAKSEAQCTNRQGCMWDTTQCAGTPAPRCAIQDYGVVPGCDVLSATAQCVGTPAACARKMQVDCGETPGCTWGTSCVGGALSCGDAFDCGGCAAAPGCACNQNGTCLGTSSFDCTIFDNVDSCQSWGENFELCAWALTCSGRSTPCSELSLVDCASTAGCQIQSQ